MNVPPSTFPPEGFDARTVCVSCGYDLRGLPADGDCPECGASIERSLHGNLLRYANPDWLKVIVRGQRMVKWGVWAVAAFIPIMILFIVMFGFVLAGKVSVIYENLAMYISTGLLFIGLLLGGIGGFVAAAAEPSAADRESPWSVRRMTRVGVIAAIVVGAVHYGLGEFLVPAGLPMFHEAGRAAIAILMTFACAAMFRRFEALARRIPDAALEKRFRRHFKYVVWSVPLLFITSIFNQPGGGMVARSTWFSAAAGILGLVAGCTVLVLLIELCKTMSLFQRQLHHVQSRGHSSNKIS